MALVNNQPKKESPGIGIRKSKSLLLSGTSLASVESLSMPLVCLYLHFLFHLLIQNFTS